VHFSTLSVCVDHAWFNIENRIYIFICDFERKRFKDSLKSSLKDFNIDTETWEEMANDRATWRSLMHKGAALSERNRTLAAEEKRRARKLRASIDDNGDGIPCPHCQKTFRARIGLTSHLRTDQPKVQRVNE